MSTRASFLRLLLSQSLRPVIAQPFEYKNLYFNQFFGLRRNPHRIIHESAEIGTNRAYEVTRCVRVELTKTFRRTDLLKRRTRRA
jgi:hypothetical protein